MVASGVIARVLPEIISNPKHQVLNQCFGWLDRPLRCRARRACCGIVQVAITSLEVSQWGHRQCGTQSYTIGVVSVAAVQGVKDDLSCHLDRACWSSLVDC